MRAYNYAESVAARGDRDGWAAKENQVCLAHLIRDVQYAIDAGDGIFAPALRHLLGRACRIAVG